MTVDRNIVIKFHKQGESNSSIAKRLKMNRTTVWKIVKKFNETGTTLDKPGRGRKRTVCTPKLYVVIRIDLIETFSKQIFFYLAKHNYVI